MKYRVARILLVALFTWHPGSSTPGAAQPAVTHPSTVAAQHPVPKMSGTGVLRALPAVPQPEQRHGALGDPQSMPATLRGPATWFRAPAHTAAAGPRLRHALGPGWRGQTVLVCREGATWITCTGVKLTDWCACGHGRLIDLSATDFRALAPLSKGVVQVHIKLELMPEVPLPPTDTAP